MYIPPAFRVDDLSEVHRLMREARSATLVTATAEGLVGTPLPMILDEREGPYGTLYAHVARANTQWKLPATGEAMAIFSGPEAYVTPSWYVAKQETHKVVPTWNYVAVHAYGPAEFFEDADRLLDAVTRLTNHKLLLFFLLPRSLWQSHPARASSMSRREHSPAAARRASRRASAPASVAWSTWQPERSACPPSSWQAQRHIPRSNSRARPI